MLDSWVYTTYIEQLLLLVSILFLIGFTIQQSISFHLLQVNVSKLGISMCLIYLLEGYGSTLDLYIVKCFVLLVSLVILLFWELSWWGLGWGVKLELEVLYLLNISSVLLFTSSYDIILFYLLLETQSLIIYTIIILFRVKEVSLSVEACIKYFILGGFSTSGLLLGGVLLYGIVGSTNLLLIIPLIEGCINSEVILIAVSLIMVTILFKLGAAPLHFWSVDVCNASPLFVIMFILTIPKVRVLCIINMLNKCLLSTGYSFNGYLVISILFSLLIGAYGAYIQVNIPRLLAYSSISNLGIILIGFILMDIFLSLNAWLYIYAYSFLLILVTGVFSLMLKYESFDMGILRFQGCLSICDLRGLDLHNSTSLIGVGFMVFSLLGVPPLLGFYIKLNILVSSFSYGLSLIGVFILCFSIVNALVYLRLIKELYLNL